MAADVGHSTSTPALAAQVCVACKARKKKCDKVLPRCSYCSRKELNCEYEHGLSSHVLPAPTPFQLFPLNIVADPSTSLEAHLYLQVHGLIRQMGKSVEDVNTRYFLGIHRYFPIVSRTRLHKGLLTLGAAPNADLSILLLAISLASSFSGLERRARHVTNDVRQLDRRSLYLAVKSLFAQVQALLPPSVPLIQAGLLIALYEHGDGRPDAAFASIALCARMAYTAGIHVCNSQSSQTHLHPNASEEMGSDARLHAQEASSTWWAIVICERAFYCDVTVPDQPLITVIPNGNIRLPLPLPNEVQDGIPTPEPAPSVPVSCLGAVNISSFARTAQAAWLLDQALKSFEISNLDSKLLQLQGLDSSLQSFLGTVLEQCNTKDMDLCEAVAIGIRALFALHEYILSQSAVVSNGTYHPMKEWCKCSNAALDTAVNMVLDVVEAHDKSDSSVSYCMVPSYPYLVQVALEHIYQRKNWNEDDWLRNAEKKLCKSLERSLAFWSEM